MLDTCTRDTIACVEQAARIVEAGGEMVRVTAPGLDDAANLACIQAEWRARGFRQPLVADIHFNPEGAMVAACHVEKVRINPGNFAEARGGRSTDDEEAYADGARGVRERLLPLIARCREHGTALRVGTNHGSLSERVTRRHGNTPGGMVEATMEYLRVCRDEGFGDVVVSLKSSDCRVMVQAVRMLVRRMEEEGMAFPLHLGVTEAGEGEDGRVRSAVGIGTLLNEGIGDTIRVSLTEAPEREIPVARELVGCCRPRFRGEAPVLEERCARPVVVADVSGAACLDGKVMRELDFVLERENDPVRGDVWGSGPRAPEMLFTGTIGPVLTGLPEGVTVVVPAGCVDVARVYRRATIPYMDVPTFKRERPGTGCLEVRLPGELDGETRALLAERPGVYLVLFPPSLDYALYRDLFETLEREGVSNRTIARVAGDSPVTVPAHVGGLFLDRLPHGIWVTCQGVAEGVELARQILQSTGTRRYKTEFVSCPGCGRTSFRLQDVAREVKGALAGFPRLKIAVMGCIVNGPGEMGDADYGYVGAGRGKVTLYKGKDVARRNVPEEEAVEALRQLITAEMKM
jgi:(E)-4-hydroxy-3-methylbut-2-enyl-diphosphate synthase